MTDLKKLKELAEKAKECEWLSDDDFVAYMDQVENPDVILDLISKLEVATKVLEYVANIKNIGNDSMFNVLANEALKELEK